MNLLLLTPQEAKSSSVVLTGRRARHIRKVLRASAGDRLRVGIENGPQGSAVVDKVDVREVLLQLDDFGLSTPPRGQNVLVLAIARPKVLLRCLEHAAALGYGRIILFRSKRVDKNHLSSSALDPENYQDRLRLGLEQSRRTHLPEVRIHRRFRACVAEHAQWVTECNRFTAHPDAARALSLPLVKSGKPHTLVIGPEGGLLDFEVEALGTCGFTSVHVGPQPLRVESALSFISGHLAALCQTE